MHHLQLCHPNRPQWMNPELTAANVPDRPQGIDDVHPQPVLEFMIPSPQESLTVKLGPLIHESKPLMNLSL
jgi:hypothetical protein